MLALTPFSATLCPGVGHVSILPFGWSRNPQSLFSPHEPDEAAQSAVICPSPSKGTVTETVAALSLSASDHSLHAPFSTGRPPQHVVSGESPQHPAPLQHSVVKLVGNHSLSIGVPSQRNPSGFKIDENSSVYVLAAVLIEVTSIHWQLNTKNVQIIERIT